MISRRTFGMGVAALLVACRTSTPPDSATDVPARPEPASGPRPDATASCADAAGAKPQPREPTERELEMLLPSSFAPGPRVLPAWRDRVRLAANGPAVGTRAEAPWGWQMLPLLEEADGRVRVAVGVRVLDEADVRAAAAAPTRAIRIVEPIRLLVWLDDSKLAPLLREDVELQPTRPGTSSRKGWDARVVVDAGTPFRLVATEGNQRRIEVRVGAQTLLGWVAADSIHHVLDHRRPSPLDQPEVLRTALLTGAIHVRPGGERLVDLVQVPAEVLEERPGWARVRSRGLQVTVQGWARASDVTEPAVGGFGVGHRGEFTEDGLDERAALLRSPIPRGALLRDPSTQAVIGVAREATVLGRDADGKLWAPSPWGAIEVCVLEGDAIALP